MFGSAPKMVELFAGCEVPLDVAQVCFVPSFVLWRNQGRMKAVRTGNASRRAVKFFKEKSWKTKNRTTVAHGMQVAMARAAAWARI